MSKYTSEELTQLLEVAVSAAKTAGEYITSNRPKEFSSKAHQNDIVTEMDVKAEQLIFSILESTKIPFLGEESATKVDLSNTWVVDPIDGTLNFLTNSPLVGVNIALFKNNEPLLAVTYLPFLKELYTSIRGKGVYFNEKKLPKLKMKGEQHLPVFLDHADIMNSHGYPVRSLGAASVEMAWVARGLAGGVSYAKIKPWDVAPGILFIQELSGVVVPRFLDKSIFLDSIIAGNITVVNTLSKQSSH